MINDWHEKKEIWNNELQCLDFNFWFRNKLEWKTLKIDRTGNGRIMTAKNAVGIAMIAKIFIIPANVNNATFAIEN